jgi:hypothetical protein
MKKKLNSGIAIDINTISNFTFGGKKLPISEILDILKKTNVLIYDGSRGEVPFLFDPGSDIKLIESTTDEAKEALRKYYETKD